MPRKNYKWNISKEEGITIVNQMIKEILEEYNRLEFSELNFILQNRSKEVLVMNNQKKKTLINFIKTVLGGLRYYLEENKDLFFLINDNSKLYIQLNDDIRLKEWTIIDDY
tara:strand:- start:706 stop:1038 length:333 start_codon:yes stop_codon:yes gene_type:complete